MNLEFPKLNTWNGYIWEYIEIIDKEIFYFKDFDVFIPDEIWV